MGASWIDLDATPPSWVGLCLEFSRIENEIEAKQAEAARHGG